MMCGHLLHCDFEFSLFDDGRLEGDLPTRAMQNEATKKRPALAKFL
jgi:hypothetical protein